MITVFKYPLSLKEEVHICLPAGALPLAVGNQNEQLMLWAEVDTEAVGAVEGDWFCVYVLGTGHEKSFGPKPVYKGTVFFHDALVFHVYVEKLD